MINDYLFPNRFKRIGIMILIPAIIAGLITLITDYSPSVLDFTVPSITIDYTLSAPNEPLIKFIENNLLNEILGILTIVSALMVAFSKEKIEDEYIAKIRLESLVWAVYINYGVLIFAFLFVFDLSFLWVMILNMFTILIFFIIRFNWQINNKNTAAYEE